jgi:RimJ/RimL family protein N-acetyltransferase
VTPVPPRPLQEYRADVQLRDGTPAVVRAIQPTDKAALLEGLRQLSPESAYRRFLGVKKTLTEAELRYLTEVDFVRHVALVAFLPRTGGDEPLGVARYVRIDDGTPPTRAEVAFAVSDPWQGHGVATALLDHLVLIGRQSGVKEFVADVLADNAQMLEVFEHSGLPMRITIKAHVQHVILSLEPT